jgi:hypothetical protein
MRTLSRLHAPVQIKSEIEKSESSGLIPRKSAAYGRATLGDYAGPDRILKELSGSGFPFPVLQLSMKDVSSFSKRGTGNGKRSIHKSHPRPILRGRPKRRILDVVDYCFLPHSKTLHCGSIYI